MLLENNKALVRRYFEEALYNPTGWQACRSVGHL